MNTPIRWFTIALLCATGGVAPTAQAQDATILGECAMEEEVGGPRSHIDDGTEVRALVVLVRFRDDTTGVELPPTSPFRGWPYWLQDANGEPIYDSGGNPIPADYEALPHFGHHLIAPSVAAITDSDSTMSAYFYEQSKVGPNGPAQFLLWGDVLPTNGSSWDQGEPIVYVTEHDNEYYHYTRSHTDSLSRGYGYLTKEVLDHLVDSLDVDLGDYNLNPADDDVVDQIYMFIRHEAAGHHQGISSLSYHYPATSGLGGWPPGTAGGAVVPEPNEAMTMRLLCYSLLLGLVVLPCTLDVQAQVPADASPLPLVANRPVPHEALPDLARALLDGTLTRGGAEPDTVLPWRYLPLAVGNAWEYETWFGHARIDIPKDTLIEGRRYFLWDERGYDTGGRQVRGFRPSVRYDSSAARVVRWYRAVGTDTTFIFAPCPLDAAFDSTVECFEGIPFEVTGTYDGVLDFEPDITVTNVAVKSYSAKYSLDRFAAGFGKALYEDFGGWYYALRYARVGGEEYGEELFPVASEEAAPAAAALRIEAWPNPFRGPLRAAFTLERPEPVTLEVVDVLGRVVLRRDLGPLPTGAHETGLDGASLGAGVYILRLSAQGETRAARAVTKFR